MVWGHILANKVRFGPLLLAIPIFLPTMVWCAVQSVFPMIAADSPQQPSVKSIIYILGR